MFFIPALVALAALALGARPRLLPADAATAATPQRCWSRCRSCSISPTSRAGALAAAGASSTRSRPNVRLAGGLARAGASWSLRDLAADPAACSRRGRGRPGRGCSCVAAGLAPGNSSSSAQWAAGRTVQELSRPRVELGRLLPPGTLVHGKLANGLSLENRIKPIFVGRGFGNYDDRLSARRCAIYSDLRGAEPRATSPRREPGHPGRARRLSRTDASS